MEATGAGQIFGVGLCMETNYCDMLFYKTAWSTIPRCSDTLSLQEHPDDRILL